MSNQSPSKTAEPGAVCDANDLATRAWNIHNILEFMAAGLDDDKPDGLPVRCTIYQLLGMASELATLVQDAEWQARHV